MNKLKYLLLASSLLIGFMACERGDEHEFETVISEHGEDDSHENGENCMRCHYTEGEGEGWFTTAGTVVGEGGGNGSGDDKGGSAFSDLEVWITSLPNGQGQILQRIQVDDRGNFYTTQAIDYSQPRYVILRSPNEVERMHGAIHHGQCNLCHGVNTDKIEL